MYKNIYTYVQPSLLQAIKREAQDLSNILHASSIQKTLFAWVPLIGSIIKTHHSTRHIPIDLLRVLNRVASKGFVNKSASWSLVPTCSSTMHLLSTSQYA